MSKSLPTDLRRFGLGTLLTVTTMFAISFGLDRLEVVVPNGFVIACTAVWLAMAAMTASDFLDARPVDQRAGLSLLLNSIAIVILPVAMIAWFGMLFLWLCSMWIRIIE